MRIHSCSGTTDPFRTGAMYTGCTVIDGTSLKAIHRMSGDKEPSWIPNFGCDATRILRPELTSMVTSLSGSPSETITLLPSEVQFSRLRQPSQSFLSGPAGNGQM